MAEIDTVLFPAGANVIVVGLASYDEHDSLTDIRTQFASSKTSKPALLMYGKLLEPFSRRNPLLMQRSNLPFADGGPRADSLPTRPGDSLAFTEPHPTLVPAALLIRRGAGDLVGSQRVRQFIVVRDLANLADDAKQSCNRVSTWDAEICMLQEARDACGRLPTLSNYR